MALKKFRVSYNFFWMLQMLLSAKAETLFEALPQAHHPLPRQEIVYQPLFVVGNQPSDAKNSLVSLTTVPESSSSASRFGMLIRPLKVSAMLHSRPRSIVAPRMDTKE